MDLSTIELAALQYVVNTGGSAGVVEFDDDHEPVGPTLRSKLMPIYMAVGEGGRLCLTHTGQGAIAPRRAPPNKLPQGWGYHEARAVNRWILGCDLGQTTDPTALAAMNHCVTPLATWTPNGKAQRWKQDRTERFDVLHLERLPLGMPYPMQVQHVANVLARSPLIGAKLVIDETGVGRAVGDIFNTAGMYPVRITITAGLEITQHGNSYHVPKSVLMSTVEARQHTRELRVAPNAADAATLANELKDFQRHVTAAGRATWGARTGAHDDLVLAVAIALWFATSGPVSSSEPLLI